MNGSCHCRTSSSAISASPSSPDQHPILKRDPYFFRNGAPVWTVMPLLDSKLLFQLQPAIRDPVAMSMPLHTQTVHSHHSFPPRANLHEPATRTRPTLMLPNAISISCSLNPQHHPRPTKFSLRFSLHRPSNTQLPYLPQYILNPRIQIPTRVLVPRTRIHVLLHLRHATVRLRAEPKLDLHQGFEGWIEVGYPK